MKPVRNPSPSFKIPEADLDLFVACGEALLRKPGESFGCRGDRLYLLREMWNREAPILKAYAIPAGLTWAHVHAKDEEEWKTLIRYVVAVLDRMVKKGSPIGGSEGFAYLSLPAFAILAVLSACWMYLGDGVKFERLFPLLDLTCRTPSALRALLEEVRGLCAREKGLFSWSWPRGEAILASTLMLSPDAVSRLGLPATPSEEASRPTPPSPATPSRFPVVMEESLDLGDVVLPPSMEEELDFLAAVLEAWLPPLPVILFYGPPGTGKTHAARALAGEVGRPLLVGEIPSLLNMYVGETEKALWEIFEAAEREEAILFLDEADAFLMDRSNMMRSWELTQINTLLSLLDRQKVPVILCTNFMGKMDGAIHRRIHHRIEFPVPGEEEREAIWRKELERQGVEGKLDLERLAEVVLTGGLIRNAVQQAARRDLVEGWRRRWTTEEMLAFARRELPKLGESRQKRVVGFARGVTGEPEPSPEKLPPASFEDEYLRAYEAWLRR